MSWTPSRKVLTPRAAGLNLLTYLTDEDRQQDAYTWAGDGSLKLLKTPTQTVANRSIPIYPSVAFVDDEDNQSAADDMITGVYVVTFELQIQNSDPDTALTQAQTYEKAATSMVANCPDATLLADTGATVARLLTIDTRFEAIRTNEQRNDFLQSFTIKASYGIAGSAYE